MRVKERQEAGGSEGLGAVSRALLQGIRYYSLLGRRDGGAKAQACVTSYLSVFCVQRSIL